MSSLRTPERFTPAANTYADEIGASSRGIPYGWYMNDLAAAFDAGHAAALATVAPVQPVTRETLRSLPKGDVVRGQHGGIYQSLGDGRFQGLAGRIYATPEMKGEFTLLAPVPATTEPVRLTDPDDPRIKPGARVSIATEWIVSDELRDSTHRPAERVHDWIEDAGNNVVYLLTEAPVDPDAEMRAELDLRGIDLDVIRALGYNVVSGDPA